MAANDDVISCGADFTLEELLVGAIGQTATGKNYLRTYTATGVAGSKAVICGGATGQPEVDSILKSLFTLNASGDMCIRLATT